MKTRRVGIELAISEVETSTAPVLLKESTIPEATISGSRIKTLKMLGAVGELFLVSFFTFIVTFKIKSGWKKGVFIF